jgi:predicted amidohydrolase
MLKVGIVQAAPVFQNLEASLALAVEYINKAASQGARLIVLGKLGYLAIRRGSIILRA